jgi:hypothetical protein
MTNRPQTNARRRQRRRSSTSKSLDAFRVIPERRGGEQSFPVVAPSGVPLYSFADLQAATSEAAELNSTS